MAIAFVRKFFSSGAGTTIVLTVPAAGCAAGNNLVIGSVCADRTFNVSSIADSKGNSYTAVDRRDAGVATDRADVLSSCRLTTGLVSGDTITLTLASSTGGSAIAAEFSGLAAASFFDKGAGAEFSSDSATFDSGATATTTQADELIFGNLMALSGIAVGPSGTFSEIDEQTFFSAWVQQCQYKVVAATGTYNSTGTLSPIASYIAQVGTFKAALSASSVMVPRHALGGGRW